MQKSAFAKLESGFSLFEVLITVVVLSIGLLGLAGIQIVGLRAANSAQEHFYASLLAQDIEERIHANQLAAANYAPFTLGSGGGAPSAPLNCAATECTPAQMHDFDTRRWYFMISGGGDPGIDNSPVLPNASINIAAAGGTYTVNITWGDPSAPSALQSLTTYFTL